MRPPILFVTPMCGVFVSLGERGAGKYFFVIFTKLNSSQDFFCIAKIWVLMVLFWSLSLFPERRRSLKENSCTKTNIIRAHA